MPVIKYVIEFSFNSWFKQINIVESKNYNDRETVIVYQGIIKELKNTLNKIENDLVE